MDKITEVPDFSVFCDCEGDWCFSRKHASLDPARYWWDKEAKEYKPIERAPPEVQEEAMRRYKEAQARAGRIILFGHE